MFQCEHCRRNYQAIEDRDRGHCLCEKRHWQTAQKLSDEFESYSCANETRTHDDTRRSSKNGIQVRNLAFLERSVVDSALTTTFPYLELAGAWFDEQIFKKVSSQCWSRNSGIIPQNGIPAHSKKSRLTKLKNSLHRWILPTKSNSILRFIRTQLNKAKYDLNCSLTS